MTVKPYRVHTRKWGNNLEHSHDETYTYINKEVIYFNFLFWENIFNGTGNGEHTAVCRTNKIFNT